MDLRKNAKRHWPLIATIIILLATTFSLFFASAEKTNGHFIYTGDDVYIHLAIAKNLALHGVWGVTIYGFSSSSSSMLWPVLLSAAYFVFGVGEMMPLFLNVVFGLLLICVSYIILLRYRLSQTHIFLTLMALLFFTPLPWIIFTGMEHVLQTLITILFFYLSAKALSKETPEKEGYLLLALAPLLTMSRYEGLFLGIVASILFAFRRRFIFSLLLFCMLIAPVVAYGIISISEGWLFLPNSVTLKGNFPEMSMEGAYLFAENFIKQVVTSVHLTAILTASVIFLILRLRERKNIWEESTTMLLIFISTAILHAMFSRVGLFFRYEAYLMAIGILSLSINIRRGIPFISLIAVITLTPLLSVGFFSLEYIPDAARNIYEQQYQTALFVEKYYTGEVIAVNDIGFVNYLSDIKCLDLFGLGSLEVVKSKIDKGYNTQEIYDISKKENAKIAIIYDSWFDEYGGLPKQWIKVGEWKIPNNLVCGDDTVSIYAVDPQEKERLVESLRSFSPSLPETVIQRGEYYNSS